ncbi:MAG: hypothetical protein M3O35_18810 [Acidobacteriota bacterium]|nr:hypothetical protein [Acidobacteriota bacterium]
MAFGLQAYGSKVAAILALDGDGGRLIPLVSGKCSSEEARAEIAKQKAMDLFPRAKAPTEALAGLWLYFSCSDEAHGIVQDLGTTEGSFWHAIVHRQEPDPANSSYWFRRVGTHPVYRGLRSAAEDILQKHPAVVYQAGSPWDPVSFIDFCERARVRPGSEEEQAALEIQRAEWQLLFDYCARPRP